MKNIFHYALVALLLLGCTQIEPVPSQYGEVNFRSVTVDSFMGNMPHGRTEATSEWHHFFKSKGKLDIRNKLTGETYNLDYNPNDFGEGYRILLPFGTYSYSSVSTGGIYAQHLPFRMEGEFQLSASSLEVTLNARIKHGLITVKNDYIKSVGIREGSGLVGMGLLEDRSYYYLYVKENNTANLEIVDFIGENLIAREIPVQAYNHYNFFLRIPETGQTNFIELSLGEFQYWEEGLIIGQTDPDYSISARDKSVYNTSSILLSDYSLSGPFNNF